MQYQPEVDSKVTLYNFTFTPRENRTAGHGYYAVLKRNEDGLTTTAYGKTLPGLNSSIHREIAWQNKNNPIYKEN